MFPYLQGSAQRACLIAVLVGGLAVCAGPSDGMARSAPSISKLQESIAALEARVNALAPLEQRVRVLEARLKQYETAATAPEPTQASGRGLVLAALTENDASAEPMRLAANADEPAPKAYGNWSGLYVGTSVGFGASGSNSRYWNRQESRSVDRSKRVDRRSSSSSSSSFSSDRDSETDTDESIYVYDSIDYLSGQSAGTEWSSGALADVYLGASMHLTPRILAGVQVEGGLSQMLFQSTIPKEHSERRSTSRDSSRSRSDDGDTSDSTGTDTRSTTQVFDFDQRNKLELDWMVSVIGRAGYLATPNTLVYGLAGWTYGHFNAEELPFSVGYGQISDFGSHGITVGGGLEQKLSSKWSLRAEYRYTNFGKERFSTRASNRVSSSSNGTSTSSYRSECCDGYSSQSASTGSRVSSDDYKDTYRSKGYFDNDMHVGRIGVTRYFKLGD